MRRSFYTLMLVFLLLGSFVAHAPIAARRADGAAGRATPLPPVSGSSAGPVVVAADERRIVLEWAAPPYQVIADALDGRAAQRVVMAGCPPAGRPGEPELPACSVLLGVPPDAAPTLRIVEAASVSLGRGFRLPPQPDLRVEPDLLAEGTRVTGAVRVEGPVYARDELFPAQPAALGEPAFLRHQRVVAVVFAPLRYRPQSGELTYTPRVRLEISWGATRAPMGDVAEPADWERLLARALLNYDQARRWRQATPPPLDLPPALPTPGYRIPVSQEGLYRLTYEWLQANGVPVEEIDDPATIRLLRYGRETAIQVLGAEDGVFGPGDAILFYGRPIEGNRYTNTEYYWLTYDGPAGRRMAQRDGVPRGIAPVPSFSIVERLEQNLLYYPDIPWRPDHDHWLWNRTFPEAGQTWATYTFPPHPLAPETYTTTLRLHLNGYTSDSVVSPDHHIRIYLNGTLLQEMYFDGRVELTPTLSVDSRLLLPNGNVVGIENPGDTGAFAEIILYDWVELGQRRLFTAEGDRLRWEGAAGSWEYLLAGFSEPAVRLLDVTDPDNPVEIVSPTVAPGSPNYTLRFFDTVTRTTVYLAVAGGRMLTPTSVTAPTPENLLDPSLGADYIVVTPGDFYAQAQALAAFRMSQGLRTMVVDIEDVYNLFAYGRRVPEALHDFLAYAYAHWTPPAPAYIVLLGDGHRDFKNYLGYGTGNFILPYMGFVDPWLGEVDADNRYVCLSGEDTLPDMHLGRLPANTPDEAQVMIDKIIAYESAPPPGAWRQQALFVTDNADQAGNFPALSDALIADLYPQPYEAQRVYLGVTHPYENPSIQARNAVIAAINEGRLLVNYIGHGGLGLWADEHLLDKPDLTDLQNAPFFPVALPMTCDEGSFTNPQPALLNHALAEVYLRSAGKGWIASWSPTGRGITSGHDYLDRGFFEAVFLDDVRHLGPATFAGKLRLFAANFSLDLLDTYILLGDPALEMPLLSTDLALDKTVAPAMPLQPGDPLTFTLRLSAAGPATAHHVVLTDKLALCLVSPTVSAAGITLTARPGTRYEWDVADMVGGQAGAITITAHLSWQTPARFYTNEARIATTAKETDLQNNADLVTFQVVAGPPYAVQVTADPPALPADGVSLSLIRAHVVDTAGNPVADGTPVAFRTDAGAFEDGSTHYTATTVQGDAAVFLRAAAEIVTATVAVTSEQAVGQVQVPFVSTEPHTIDVVAFPSAIPVTGTAAITATVRDVLGHPVRDGTGVTLTTTLGTLTPTLGATRAGIVTATLQGEGLAGLAAVIVRSGDAVGAAQVRIGTGSDYTLTLAVAPPALPADGRSTAVLTATLVRADGRPITDTHWFTFSATPGRGTITPTVRLAVGGTATATLTAGTQAGTDLLLAAAERETALAEIVFLPGAAARLTLTVGPASIPVGGASAVATAAVRDAYGNRVADGTPVAFAADLGTITPTIGATQGGQARAVLLSGTVAGTATVTAQSGPATDTAAVRFTPLGPFTVTLTATPTTVVADGQTPAALAAWVGDRYGNAVVDGTRVEFYTTLGTLRPPQAGTFQGWATATLTSTAVGTATVQCFAGFAGEAHDAEIVRFIPGPPAILALAASPARLYADGVSTATIAIYLRDAWNHPVADGTPVLLSVSRGTITPGVVAVVAGRARATLRSSNERGWAIVHAESGPAAQNLAVEFYQERVYLPLVVR